MAGNGPPETVSPSELWLRITATPRPFKVVPFPRTNPDGDPLGEVAIWVLSQGENEAAQADAGKYVREKLFAKGEQVQSDHAYSEVYNNELAVQLLFRACRRPDKLTLPVFPGASDLRSSLSLDEVSVLYNAYFLVRRELGPIVSEMSEPEMEAWISKLEKGGAVAGGLHFLSLGALTDLVCFGASRIASLEKAISSAGSPPAEPTPEA